MSLKVLRIKIAPLIYLMQKILFRMTLFSFFLLVVLVSLYIAGNFQDFLDSTQAMILQQGSFIAITLLFFASVLILFTFLDSLFSKFFTWKNLLTSIFCIISIVFSVFCGLTASGMLILSLGHSS